MGLDTSHDAWHGAYSAFSRWRDAVAEAAGYELAWIATGELFQDDMPPVGKWVPLRRAVLIDWGHIELRNFSGEWDETPADPLVLLIAHSDCDGHLEPEHCALLADRLDGILPLILEEADAGGHVGNVRAKTQQFIVGCRAAAAAGERLEFF